MSKLKFLIFASFFTLILIACSSEQKTIETLQSESTTINLDNSLDMAIENSLANYQAVVIVFYRGHFWGICRAQLGELSQNHDLFKRFGIDIIAVSTDDQENTQAMIDEVSATFEIISDSTYTISQQWEVFNILGDGVAAPAAFIVGKNNSILWGHRGSSPSDRPPTDFLLAKTLELLKKVAN